MAAPVKENLANVEKRKIFPFDSYRWITLVLTGGVFLYAGFIYNDGVRFRLGIDFESGLMLQEIFPYGVETQNIREVLRPLGGGEIQKIEGAQDNRYLIKLAAPDYSAATNIRIALASNLQEMLGVTSSNVQMTFVGPKISKDLRQQAVWLVISAIICIVLYVTLRFEWRFAVAALVTTLHDVLYIVAYILIAGLEINIPLIAAILTIVGYSINDTIVIFDRIRENFPMLRHTTYVNMVETSIQDTLSRTIITSLTTVVAVSTLLIGGGEGLASFTQALLVGVIVGTYSTIFVASPLVIMLRKN